MINSEIEIYKRLYYHAFNRYTQLLEQVQQIQQELEELYLVMGECDEERLEQEVLARELDGELPFSFDGIE